MICLIYFPVPARFLCCDHVDYEGVLCDFCLLLQKCTIRQFLFFTLFTSFNLKNHDEFFGSFVVWSIGCAFAIASVIHFVCHLPAPMCLFRLPIIWLSVFFNKRDVWALKLPQSGCRCVIPGLKVLLKRRSSLDGGKQSRRRQGNGETWRCKDTVWGLFKPLHISVLLRLHIALILCVFAGGMCTSMCMRCVD